MIPTFVIVPVKNEWHLTATLLDCLEGDDTITDILILNDASIDGTPSRIRQLQRVRPWFAERLHQTDRTGGNIYQAWNRGFARAKHLARGGPFQVLVTNNDIQLTPNACAILAWHLRQRVECWATYPDYDWPFEAPAEIQSTRDTHGVLASGGMSGSCFMLKGEAIPWEPLITDPVYQHWFGDDSLSECIAEEGGTQTRVIGLPSLHENEGTARHYPELYDVKLRDRGFWITRHQRGLRATDRR